jgi:uncharacterized protein (TIGR03382 family)
MRLGRLLALSACALLKTASALAEGSEEFDVNETVWNGLTGFLANDQAVNANSVVRVDILNDGNEKVCWRGNGNLTLLRPDGTTSVASLANNQCSNAVAGVTGAYYADIIDNQTVGTAWDIRVCASSVANNACFSNNANERTGRLWSTAWNFSQNVFFNERYSINGSVYAIVPGGAVGRDAVIEMQMRGVSGAYYTLRANGTGPSTAAGVRVGRSVPRDPSYSVSAEYPLYLNPPESAKYNWTTPVVSDVQLTPACGTGVVLARAAGRISFSSNVTGQYVVVCDVNKDSVYDFAGSSDFSSFGAAQVGTNSISWDGRNNGGVDAAEGNYNCVIRLNVGEFHYIAEDIETAYPGIRMYRLESNKTTRTPIRLFWDDTSVGASENMPNGQVSPVSPLATGLDPVAIATPAAAFYFTGGNRANPVGNARAWGDFDANGEGKGNEAYLDQFSAAETAISPALSVNVISNGGDADADGLGNARECDIGSDPGDNDTDNDGVRDGSEAPNTGAIPNTDGDAQPDVLDPDDDGDGVPTKTELGPSENGDGNPADAANSDSTAPPDYLDTDSDNDGVLDGSDVARTNPNACRDSDADACDDCSVTGANSSGGNVSNDGADTNADGQCNLGDPDDDGDGVPDASDSDPGMIRVCSDTDSDTCDDCAAGAGAAPLADGLDTDMDGKCDLGDSDDDGDGVSDASDGQPLNPKRCRDQDADGCDDCALTGKADPSMDGPDADGDGICDGSDMGVSPDDADGDGVLDANDLDDDGDGILDTQETTPGIEDDADGDGTPNQLDLDSDGDGIFDADESGHDAADKNADGRVDGPVGANGVADVVESSPDSGVVALPLDTDEDGVPDFLDVDSDSDGSDDRDEAGDDRPSTAPLDTDADGAPDFRDLDDDNDGLETPDERTPDREDIDTDGDGIPNHREADDDGDGIPTLSERPGGFDLDSDGDGKPDYLDADDDNDGVPTKDERSKDLQDIDSDDDGKPDYLDADDDDDGIPSKEEAGDSDGDGTPDRLERAEGTLAGGALCSTQPGANAGGAGMWLALAGLFAGVWLARRRRTGGKLTRTLLLLGLVTSALSASGAEAQVALEQFKPAPLPGDGFGVGRPETLPRATWGAQIWLDYANDPLVYELDPGSSKREEKVVSDHLVGHVSVAVGVIDRLTLSLDVPVHILMQGDDNLSVPASKPEGDGLGDVALAGRVLVSSLDPKSHFGAALEFIARLPTARLFNEDQLYSGDTIGSYEPAAIVEGRAGRFDIRLRAGARLRKKKDVGNLELGNELIGGLAMRLRLIAGLHLHAEAYGSTFLSDPFKRTATPIESLFGIKYWGDVVVVGAAGGPGLWRGYGSPDVRVVGTLGYAARPKKEPVDSDGDGLVDPKDRCPHEPEDKDGFEDQDGCVDPDNDKDGVRDTQDSCISEPEDTDDFDDADGCPDPDNDKDNVLDPDDVCPIDPEDLDGFEDQDGCVDPDNDKDGLLDANDRCPNEPEDVDGFEDEDGCPEPGGGLVKITCAKIEIGEAVYFDVGKDSIQSRSFDLLDQVASVLNSAKQILRVRVAGHTDDRGNDKKNLELSRRRASSVLRYLTSHGVDAARLGSEGYGESEPITSNKTADGRAQNRRVEFQILEQSSECKTPGGL